MGGKNKEKRDDWLAHVDAIRKLLMGEWNPIGCGVPDDEYDGYIPGIYRLILDGADAHRLSRHLESIEKVSMGMDGNPGRNERVAKSLLALMGR